MARKRRKRIASRGSVNNIILKTLVNGDKYGYEIIKEVEQYSDGKIILKQPSLYSSLSRFEEKKFVSSYWGDSEFGGRRHYYHLTEIGMAYYKTYVLKEYDEESDDSDTPNQDIQTVQDTNNSETILDEEKIPLQEISESEIPAIVDFSTNDNSNIQEEILAEHSFHQVTPIEHLINNNDTSSDHQVSNVFKFNDNAFQYISNDTTANKDINHVTNNISEQHIEEHTTTTNDDKPWLNLSNKAKLSNKNCQKSINSTLYLRKPKKEQYIIKDRDGILKLRDSDYIPQNTNKPKIIDNVIQRSSREKLFGYDPILNSQKNNNQPKDYTELSDNEKKIKNDNFLAKFNLLTMSKMKPVSAPAPQKVESIKKSIDYRAKLNAVFDSSNTDNFEVHEEATNNLFNYVEEDTWNKNLAESNTISTENQLKMIDEDDKIVDLEPVEFETKTDNSHYVEEINNFPVNNNQIKMNRYEHKPQTVLQDKTFVLINKLKFVFGIIMTLIMILEITTSLLVCRNLGLVVGSDMTIFIISYIIVGIFACIYILPFCFNANEHRSNIFKFRFSFLFGILTFLVGVILIYCANTLLGFELDNFKYFAVKLIIPIVLAFNFVIAPIIYALLNKNRRFYD